MRFAGNFHPEWGYLAPAPSFMRTARIVVVATAIGATAGAAVVLSLVDRPDLGPMADAGRTDTSRTMVVVRSLVQPAEAAVSSASVTEPVATMSAPMAQVPANGQANAAPAAVNLQVGALPSATPVQASAPPPPHPQPALTTAKISAPTPSDSHPVATSTAPASIASLAESPAAIDAVGSATDMVTSGTAGAPNLSAPAAQQGLVKKPLPGAVVGQQPAQHGPAPVAPLAPVAKKKTAGSGGGIAPILKRLFSAN
jgi:hypothetical protein